MAFLGAGAPPTTEVPASTTALPLPMSSLAGASAIGCAALSCVACSPTTTISVEAPESTSMAEGPDASLACELVGAEEGLTLGVAGAIAGVGEVTPDRVMTGKHKRRFPIICRVTVYISRI